MKKAQEEIKSFWMLERQKSAAYLRNDVRKFDTHPLASQPVISSLLVLQARFGEFWYVLRLACRKLFIFYIISRLDLGLGKSNLISLDVGNGRSPP